MLDIVSVNLGNRAHNVTTAQQRIALERIKRNDAGVDVIVTQEARSRFATPVGYRALPVVGGGATQVRIAVRKSLPVLGHGYLRAHPGKEGQWPARWLPMVTLDAPGIGPLTVVGMHVNSSIEAGGLPAATGPRMAYAFHNIETAADLARFARARLGHGVVMCGDLNVDAYGDQQHRHRKFPAAQFEAAGLDEALPVVRSGTHAGSARRIDRAFHTRDLDVTVRDLKRFAPYDHQPILIRVKRG
jgi:endonuclease/exonuclease/phosphatase family metal-dependent hydrolase